VSVQQELREQTLEEISLQAFSKSSQVAASTRQSLSGKDRHMTQKPHKLKFHLACQVTSRHARHVVRVGLISKHAYCQLLSFSSGTSN